MQITGIEPREVTLPSNNPLHNAFVLGFITGYLRYGESSHTGREVAANLVSLRHYGVALGLSTKAWLEWIQSEALAVGDEPLPTNLAENLRTKSGRLVDEWAPELFVKPAIVARQGAFASSVLLNDILSLLPAAKVSNLPAAARADLEAAGRCISFDMATAAAFHSMRAVETGLRLLYTVRTGKKPPEKSMGPIIRALRVEGRRDVALDLLDLIRKHFRNPTQHAGTTYSIQDAEHLFSLATFAIGKILDET